MPTRRLLSTVRSPQDLRALPSEQLPELAAEIRSFLIDHVSQTGGHLSDEEYEHARAGTDSFMDSLARCLPGMLKARHDAY